MANTIGIECSILCKNKPKSVFRKNEKEDLEEFDFQTAYGELNVKAPTFSQFLRAALPARKAGETVTSICTAAAILLNGRNQKMIALQTIIGTILRRAHAGRMAFKRLNKLHLTVCDKSIAYKQEELGVDFNKEVHAWKGALVSHEKEKSKLQREIKVLNDTVAESSFKDNQSCTRIPASDCQSSNSNVTIKEKCTFSGKFGNTPANVNTLQALQMKLRAKSLLQQSIPGSEKAVRDDVSILRHTSSHTSHVVADPIQHLRLQKQSSHQKLEKLMSTPPAGFQIVGDNVDIRENVRHMTVDNQNRDHHMFQLMAVKNRIVADITTEQREQYPVSETPLSQILPTVQDNMSLRNEFVILVGRVLTKRFSAFKDMVDVFPEHIPHAYENEAQKKSKYVMLGVLQKNEQYAEEMIQIAKYAHQFVPGHDDEKEEQVPLCKIPFTGDQLTVERLREALASVCDGRTANQRLEGLYPKLADWHALVAFYQVCWHRLYSTQSAKDIGTMHQIRNAINRRNVSKDPGSNVNATKDYLDLYTEAHIVSALFQFFSIDSVDSKPTSNINLDDLQSDDRKSCLLEVLGTFVDQFSMDQVSVVDSVEDTDTPLSCQYCGKIYKRAVFLAKHEKEKHDHNSEVSDQPNSESDSGDSQDYIYNYACTSLSMGLLAKNFQDAVKEGDGERVIRLYKFLMLHYKADGRHKYALESLYLLVQIASLLPPKEAHLLKWERFVNVRGGKGKNISLDLHLEHQNKYFKEDAKSFGGKLSERAVNRASRAVQSTEKILQNVDAQTGVKRSSGKHMSASCEKDFNIIVDHLHNNGQVFKFTKGRSHCAFPKFQRNPFSGQSVTKVRKWISRHLEKFDK